MTWLEFEQKSRDYAERSLTDFFAEVIFSGADEMDSQSDAAAAGAILSLEDEV